MTRCLQCHQNKKYHQFSRRTDNSRHAICTDCYAATNTKPCTRCGEMKTLTEFYKTGLIFSSWCKTCFSRHDRHYTFSRTPLIDTDRLPAGVALGDSTTWQHCTPSHLPPIALSGRVVGTVGGRLVAQVAGAMFMVGEK